MYAQIDPHLQLPPSIITINPTPAEKPLRVGAYCRVSTSQAAQLESIHAQKEHYEQICSHHPNWLLKCIYIEEGQSGTSMNHRPELARLINDCKSGRIDLVVTKSISRLARNTIDCLNTTRMLTGIGVQVFFEKEQIMTGTAESELMLSVMASLAEDESRSISSNTKWNCRNRFRTGTYKFSVLPYGYRLDGYNIAVDPAEAEVIKTIFTKAQSGASCFHIARELNLQKIPRRKSTGEWDSSYINKILRNPFYKGCVLHQKTYTDESFHIHMNRGEEDCYFISDHHVPIVDHHTFDTIQNLLDLKHMKIEANQKSNTMNVSEPAGHTCFTGKLKCTCGSNYRRVSGGKKSIRYFWCCSRHLASARDCPSIRLPEENIQNAFTTMLNKLDFSRSQLLEYYLHELKNESEDKYPEQQAIYEEEQKIQTSLAKLNEQRIRGTIHPSVFYSRKNALLSQSSQIALKKAGYMADAVCLTEAGKSILKGVQTI